VVHVARLLWAFSAAHRAGAGPYLPLAERAAESLESLWDPDHGGWFQEADRWGRVVDRRKTLYGQAYGIYATAEHALASGSELSRVRAVKAIELLAERGRSQEAFRTDWSEAWEPGPEEGFDPNGHLHVMEALVPAYELTGDASHGDLLREVRDLLRVRMVGATSDGGLHLVHRLGPDWRPRTGPTRMQESYGHDIETAWLLLQTAEALGEPASETLPMSVALGEPVLSRGLDRRWGGLYFRGTAEGPATNRAKVWWTQAEGLVGFLWLHVETGEQRYWEAFRSVTRWVMRRQADHRHGEWFAVLRRRGTVHDGRKSHRWKSGYHTTRACLEAVRLLSAPPFTRGSIAPPRGKP
jgi:mannose/cellobiose epimerase-like protein (N-acyl-D-glucosamine 2-epimerase family)